MTTNEQNQNPSIADQTPKKTSGVNAILEQIVGTIDKTDEKAALLRVADLRQRYPHATPNELARRLIHQRCLQAGAVGAVTSGASILPEVGTVATLVFGVAADIRMTYRIQSELVLELAAVYDRPITLDDKRYVVALVTGLSAGTNQLVTRTGVVLAEQASERLAEKALVKSIPILGVAASGGINIVATYLIGRRAQAYFSQDPALLAAWDHQVRALTGVDERRLVAWLAETTERSWRFAHGQVQNVAGAVIVAGQSAGKIAVTAGGQASGVADGIWTRLKTGMNAAGQTLVSLRQRKARRQPANSSEPSDVEGESIDGQVHNDQ